MTSPAPSKALAMPLVSFTRRFATMINCGVSLVRSLHCLIAETESPFREALYDIKESIEKGSTLTEAMKPWPALFPPLYVAMTRAGEIGGVLDETLHRTVDLLEEEWKYASLVGWQDGRPSLFFPPTLPVPHELADLPEDRRLFIQMQFCRSFGIMLSSGIPILQSMEIAADILPEVQKAQWQAQREKILKGGRLSDSGFLSPVMTQLITLGEETGTLDGTFYHTATMYRAELDNLLWAKIGALAGK